MIQTENSTHKSILLAIREAVALYLFKSNREQDIPKIANVFLSLDNYLGDRVPVTEVVKEVHGLSNILRDNYLGLHINLLLDIESLPFYEAIDDCVKPFSTNNNELSFLIVSRLIPRFFFLITQSITLKLTEEKDLLRFDFISNTLEIMNKNQIDGVMMLVYRMVEAFCSNKLKGIEVAQRQSFYELTYYQSIFGVPVEPADKASLIYELPCKNYKQATDLLMNSQEALGRRFFLNPLLNMVSTQFSEFSHTQRCEIVIETIMGMMPPTRIHVADSMNISVSTLQRRLNEEGTSFQAFLENTRKRLAKMYIAEKNLCTTDVAYLLGYRSHSQFFKAFKTWFGVTLKAYQTNFITI